MTDIIKFIKQMTNNTTNSNVMEGKRQVVTRLKFIASIAPHEKIDSRNLKIESSSIWTPIKRFFYGDSRDSTLSFFSSTIDRTFEVIDGHIHSKNMGERLFCANVISDLMLAVNGLKAFQRTYEEDKLISCEISVIIESIESKVYSIKDTHPDMFTIKKQFMAQMDEDKLLNNNERPDKIQSYRISNESGESNKQDKLNDTWQGKRSVFDPSLTYIEEEEEDEKKD